MVGEHPGKHLFIETKHPSPYGEKLEEAVAEVLRAAGHERDHRFHLISFNPEAIERFQRLLPDLETFLLLDPMPLLDGGSPVPFNPVGNCGVGPSIYQAQAQPNLCALEQPSYIWTVNLVRASRR